MDSCPPEIVNLITEQLIGILESDSDYGPIQKYSLISKFFYHRIRKRTFKVIKLPFVVNREGNSIITTFCALAAQNPGLLEDVRDLTIEFQRIPDSCRKFGYKDKQGFKKNTLQRLAGLVAQSQIHTLAIQSAICCYKFPLDRPFIGDELITALVSLRYLPSLRKLTLGNFMRVPMGLIVGDPPNDALESLVLCGMDLTRPQCAPLFQGNHGETSPNVAASDISVQHPILLQNLRNLDVTRTKDISKFLSYINPSIVTASMLPNLQELSLRGTLSIQAARQVAAQGFRPFLNLGHLKVSFSLWDDIKVSSDFGCYPNLKRFTIMLAWKKSNVELCKILSSLRIPPSTRTVEIHFRCPVTATEPFRDFVQERFNSSFNVIDDTILSQTWVKDVALNLVFLFNTPTVEWDVDGKLPEADRTLFDDAARKAFPKSFGAAHLNFSVDSVFNNINIPSCIF